jgi:hypothetical protein
MSRHCGKYDARGPHEVSAENRKRIDPPSQGRTQSGNRGRHLPDLCAISRSARRHKMRPRTERRRREREMFGADLTVSGSVGRCRVAPTIFPRNQQEQSNAADDREDRTVVENGRVAD